MFLKELIDQSDWIVFTLFGILFVSLIIQLCYSLLIYLRVFRKKKSDKRKKKIAVSVIICAKNEAENLQKNLPLFLEQDYPEFEVVVVNDCSTDNSEDVLSEMKLKYSHLRYTTIPRDEKFTHGKKLAVTVGVKSAQNECLLFSDADCYPVSKKWITTISRNFSKNTDLILGVGKYERLPGLLNLLVRYETFFTAMQYLSFAIGGKAYMGVGRNLAYKKDLFFRNKGFARHLKVLSGDDDLFVNQVSNQENTAVEISGDSFTLSSPPITFSAWFKQKKRHLTTGKYYRFSSRLRLGLEYLSRILLYAGIISLLFFDNWKWIALGAWGITSLVKLTIMKLVMNKLNEKDLLLPSLLLDLLMPLFLGIISLSNIIRPRKSKWN